MEKLTLTLKHQYNQYVKFWKNLLNIRFLPMRCNPLYMSLKDSRMNKNVVQSQHNTSNK